VSDRSTIDAFCEFFESDPVDTDENKCWHCGRGVQEHKGAVRIRTYCATEPFTPRSGIPIEEEIDRAVREGILIEVKA
jgi:hypothetical protein